MRVANKKFDEKKPFKPIDKTEPYEVYLGETFFYEQVLVNMNEMPHVLISGTTGSGKSRAMFTFTVNLIYNNSPRKVALWFAQVSDKKDVQKFAKCKHTKYFAYNLEKALQMFKYIRNIVKEKNNELTKLGLNNIVEYNKKFPDKFWEYQYIIIDEFASFMPNENREIDIFYSLKKKCLVELQHLILESRNVGLFIVSCIQRPSKDMMPPVFKSSFNVKLSYRQMNLASAKVVTDDGAVLNLPNREAIFEASERKHIKTLYIDDDIIRKYIKHTIDPNHKYIDLDKDDDDDNKEKNKDNINKEVPPQEPKKSKPKSTNRKSKVKEDVKL